MYKEAEIKHLQALSNGDTYFSQFSKDAALLAIKAIICQ